MDINKSELDSLKDFIKDCKVPLQDGVVFYAYLVLIIIGLGAVGIWGSLYYEYNSLLFSHLNIKLSIISFALPMFVLLGDKVYNLSDDIFTAKFFRLLLIIPPVLCFFTVFFDNVILGYVLGILSVVSTLFFWWIINANNPNLRKSSYLKSQKNKENELNNALNS